MVWTLYAVDRRGKSNVRGEMFEGTKEDAKEICKFINNILLDNGTQNVYVDYKEVDLRCLIVQKL